MNKNNGNACDIDLNSKNLSATIFLDTSHNEINSEKIKLYIDEIKTKFKNVQIVEFDSSFDEKILIEFNKTDLGFIMSPFIGENWKNLKLFGDFIFDLSDSMFIAFYSTLERELTKKTPLRKAISNNSSRNCNSKLSNKKCSTNFGEYGNNENYLKVPFLTNIKDLDSFTKFLEIEKGYDGFNYEIPTKTFKKMDEVKIIKKSNVNNKPNINFFFQSALPELRKLAIEMAGIPINKHIIKEFLKREKFVEKFPVAFFENSEKDKTKTKYLLPIDNKIQEKFKKFTDNFSKKDIEKIENSFEALYFSQLINYKDFTFKDGVTNELLNYISLEELRLNWAMMADILIEQFGEEDLKQFIIETTLKKGNYKNDLDQFIELYFKTFGK